MPTTAAPKASTTSSVPSSDQESMTPTLSWECDSFPEYNGNNDNMESYPDEDWWNSELLLHPQQYDPFLQASTTTAASMDIIHHSNNNINDDNEKKSAPFRIARRSPKLRLSLPTFANKTTSTLRIQDVLERLDLSGHYHHRAVTVQVQMTIIRWIVTSATFGIPKVRVSGINITTITNGNVAIPPDLQW